MFEPNSRYYSLDTAISTLPSGQQVAYVRRRFLPSAKDALVLATVSVAAGDRLDLMAARLLGDAEQFWQICDANDAMNPPELTAEIGRKLDISIAQPTGI